MNSEAFGFSVTGGCSDDGDLASDCSSTSRQWNFSFCQVTFAAVGPGSPTAYRALKGASTDAGRRLPQLDRGPVRFPEELFDCRSSDNRSSKAQIVRLY